MLEKHHIGYLILMTVLSLILFVAFQPKAILVDQVQAQYAPMRVTIEEEGKTRVIDHFVITAPIDAYMHRIHFNEGDSVQKGQTLFILESLPAPILNPRSRAQAAASLGATEALEKIIQEISAAANADKELADITFNRTTQLRKKKVISQNELDTAKAEKRRAEAIYRASQFSEVLTQYLTQISHSSLNYEAIRPSDDESHHFKVTSIADGTILKLANKSERVVKVGAPLLEMGNIEHIEVESDVLSTLAVKLKPGMPVEILRWGGYSSLQGVIKRIEPAGFTKISALGVEEQRVKVILDISTEYSRRKQLAHNFRVEVRFILWRSDKVLQIPNSALFRHNNVTSDNPQEEWAVYVIKGSTVQTRSVKIGHRNKLMAEVSEGLVEGESLVSYLSNELKEGVKIETR